MGVVAVLANMKRMLGKRIPFLSLSYSSWNPVSTPILGHNHPYFWVPSGCVRPRSSGFHTNGQVATLINGKSIAEDIKSQIAVQICNMKAAIGKSPVLAVVLVGKRRDSHTFLRIKLNACDEVGIASLTAELPEDCTEDEILHVVSSFNQNPSVHGIIIQLPLPQHLDEEKVINCVSPEKDVDSFHPFNMGNLAMRDREPFFIPCASKGCIELLLRHGVEITGKKAVVIGRSKIVSLPTSLLLQRHHATVSSVHAFTKQPEQITCEADIVVSDIGFLIWFEAAG